MKTRIFILAIAILLPNFTKAEEPTILINEICWMGTTSSSNDEWLELYNQSENDIDLTGWRLEADDGSPKINLAGIIPAGGYFLLERTDDESVPGISADLIYTGSLSNTGEWLKLYDSQNNLIDEINPADGWPGGDNTAKQTLERAPDNSWQTSLEPSGTPRAENSTGGSDDGEGDGTEDNDQQDDEEDEQAQADQSSLDEISKAEKGDIVINEIFPDPKVLTLKMNSLNSKMPAKK